VDKTGGFVVTATDYMLKNYVLVALPLAVKPPDLVELIFQTVARWQPKAVAIESDVFANTYQYWLRSEMQKRGTYFNVVPVFTKKQSKPKRIMGLSNYLSSENLYYNKSQTQLLWEHSKFGKVKLGIHILDALAYGPEIWQRGNMPGWHSLQASENFDGDFMADRDVETGYSVIN
jgi:hypothetical protein